MVGFTHASGQLHRQSSFYVSNHNRAADFPPLHRLKTSADVIIPQHRSGIRLFFRETRNSRLTPVNGSGLLLPRFTCYMRCLGATAALVFGNRAIRRGGELWGSTFKWQSAQSGQVWA
jgi:hypothetical protein